jgi:heat shock protein beta-11
MARVLLSTSYDPDFPPENVLTSSNKEFWMSTGLFPQEIVFQLPSSTSPRVVRVVSSNVRQIVIEACEGAHIGSFSKVGESEFGNNGGELQKESVDLNVPKPVNFIRVVFMTGWDEFISVHSVKIE